MARTNMATTRDFVASREHVVGDRVSTDGRRLRRITLFEHSPEIVKKVMQEEAAKPWTGYDPRFADAGDVSALHGARFRCLKFF